jgi:hypothetical protein
MESKRGQVTIFIVLAIIIVAAIILYFTLSNKTTSAVSPETNEINNFVKDCIKRTGKDAVYHVSQNGGYFLPTKISTTTGIPYYYYSGENLMLSKTEVQNQISLYMSNMLEYCIDDFKDFPQFDINSGEVSSEVTIGNEVVFNVKYPLSITRNEKTYLLENFEGINVAARLNIIYESIEEIIRNQLSSENICISCITNIALENDLIIDMVGLEEATFFTIQDNNSKINEVPLKWNFANKY